ncbi:hypothetical protein D9758_016166 [Tetrapyrgos nigripes]|uniref:CCHC-type domain-containing protein n=1 Tax=Tetrapyrgos nigripes TaxID=182062 RepID=A0A8H5CIP0_9AGAR|nr:hypothetical protein D9758_016166 [Tetrapyrgos nigripes]
MPENTNPNYVMPLSDINKAFDSLTVLTGSENWKMWYFHVNSALQFKSLTKLWKLFNLRKPVWEFDKLLNEAQDLWASIKKRDIDVSDQVFYSALVGIIPPHYHFVCSSYEATVDAAAATWDATTAAEGEKPVYRAVDLIAQLKKEFTNYRLSNARTYPSKKSSVALVKAVLNDRTSQKGNMANAAAPYQKPSDGKKDQKCFNCNKMGHTTQTCPEPWTEKSKEAMKKKGITKQSNKGKTKENASVAISMPASSSSQIATTSTSQSDWVQSISSGDVEMEDSETPVSHHISLPAFTAISDQDHTYIIDSGATIHCTPYVNLLFNVHTTPAITLTVANSEHLDLRLAGDMRVEVRKDNARTSKLTPKGKRGVWLGFDNHSKGHYVYFGTKVNVERNLQFLTSKSQVEGELQNKNQEPLETTEENTNETPTSQEHEPEPMDVDEDETKQPDGPRRSKRI